MGAAELILAGTSLTPARSRALGYILRAENGARTVGELSRELAQSRQATALLMQRMAADGLVELDDSPRHRRALLIRATTAGNELYRIGNTRQNSFNAALDALVPVEDLITLRKALIDYAALFDQTLEREFEELCLSCAELNNEPSD